MQTKLYTIVSDNVHGSPEPLYDEETGAPWVFLRELCATLEVEAMNHDTDGGYYVLGFEPEP